MDSRVRSAIFWVPYPALSFPADSSLRSNHAPSARRMIHGPHHGPRSVGHRGGDGMGHAVGRKSSPRCSFWAAGARPIRIPARAQALMLRNDATGLRALGLKPASLLRTAQASLPVPRSHRAPASQGQSQNLRGGDLRTGLRALGHTPFPKTPACAPAPDWRPIPSLRSVIPQAASRARFALDQAPHRSRLGTLPLLSLVGTRSCLYVTGSVSAGALPLPCAALGRLITALRPFGGLRKLLALGSESSCRFLRSLGRPARIVRLRSIEPQLAGEADGLRRSPNQPRSSSKPWINRNSNFIQCTTKPE
jgi:hypothetical protein